SKSPKVKRFNSFFNTSARCGPIPFRYSIGVFNMLDEKEIVFDFQQIYDVKFTVRFSQIS
ncbi:MAG TPA: hypothetical protein PLG88_06415, partial [Chitinophagaceae bacterium]|nr:hypothetical protein [Chitinophagaceae bacterium]